MNTNITLRRRNKQLKRKLAKKHQRLNIEKQIAQLAKTGHYPEPYYRASVLAVKGYQSPRLGYEVCYGILPEAYD